MSDLPDDVVRDRAYWDLQAAEYVEAPDDPTTRYPFVTLDRAGKWLCEEVWNVRKIVR